MSSAYEARLVGEPPADGWGTEAAAQPACQDAQDQHTRRMINVRCRWCGADMPPLERPAVSSRWVDELEAHLLSQHSLPRGPAHEDVRYELLIQVCDMLGWSVQGFLTRYVPPKGTVECEFCHGIGETWIRGAWQVCPICCGHGYRAAQSGLWPLEEAAS